MAQTPSEREAHGMDSRLVGIGVAIALAASGCSSSGGSSGTKGPANEPVAGSAVLTIQGFAYKPKPLTVTPGQTVTITNLDGSEHTVTSDKDGAFKVDDVSKGKTFTFKAPTEPGTYTFYCEYHGSMHGTLIVKAP